MSLLAALRRLRERVGERRAQRSAFERAVIALEDAEFPATLSSASPPVFWWRNRDQTQEVLGAGVAWSGSLADLPGPPEVARGDAAPSLFLALPFARPQEATGTPCGDGAEVSLPLLAWRRSKSRAVLDLLLPPGREDEVIALLEALGREPGRAKWPRFGPLPPDMDTKSWNGNVTTALEAIADGAVEKVVLARTLNFEAEGEVPRAVLIERLRRAPQPFYGVLVAPTLERTFFCVSPERLYRRQGRQLEAEALAGSAPPPAAETLRTDPKTLHEHRVVATFLGERLGALCHGDVVSEPAEILALPDLLHRRTRLRAQLRSDVDDRMLLERLHPTPATCGSPPAPARALIERLEPKGRGLYCGALGLLGEETSEVAVAIRSGLLEGRRLALHVGAGIVAGSDAAAEFQETTWKAQTLLGLLGAD